MPREHPGCGGLHRLAVADVASLGLAAELLGERAQALFSPGQQHAVPAALAQQARGRLADAGGGPRHDRYPLNVATVPRLISTVSRMSSAYPPASVTQTGVPAERSVSRTYASRASRPCLESASRPSRSPT